MFAESIGITVKKMDELRFHDACDQIVRKTKKQNGIGTLGEKTLHAVLKHYLSPDTMSHEQRVGRFVADIKNDNGIIEIQTRNFDKLRRKLDAFLPEDQVTIVYPIAKTKWIYWIDNETGAVSSKRKSPKQGTIYELLVELYRIKFHLLHPNIHFCIIMLEIDEFRNLDGWSENKKKGASKFDRIPIELTEEVHIREIIDYQKFIPDALNAEFTSRDFQKASGMSLSGARTALNVLYHVHAVNRVGKAGNAFLYERNLEKKSKTTK